MSYFAVTFDQPVHKAKARRYARVLATVTVNEVKGMRYFSTVLGKDTEGTPVLLYINDRIDSTDVNVVTGVTSALLAAVRAFDIKVERSLYITAHMKTGSLKGCSLGVAVFMATCVCMKGCRVPEKWTFTGWVTSGLGEDVGPAIEAIDEAPTKARGALNGGEVLFLPLNNSKDLTPLGMRLHTVQTWQGEVPSIVLLKDIGDLKTIVSSNRVC